MVFEIVEVPKDGLSVESTARIGHREVHVGTTLLDGSEVGEGFFIVCQHLGVESPTLPFLVEKEPIESLVAEVLLEVETMVIIDGVEFGHRKSFGMEMSGVGEECFVFADVVVDAADGGFSR